MYKYYKKIGISILTSVNLILISYPAFAYLDPGTLGLIFSFVVGGISFIILKIKVIYTSIKKMFMKIIHKK